MAEEPTPSELAAVTAVEQPEVSDLDALRYALFDQAIQSGTTDPVPIFYSRIERVLREKLPERFLPAQAEVIPKGPGIRADDVKWSGLLQWLQAQPQNQKLTKQQVLDAFDLNRIQITETLQGSRQWTPMWFPPRKPRSF